MLRLVLNRDFISFRECKTYCMSGTVNYIYQIRYAYNTLQVNVVVVVDLLSSYTNDSGEFFE